ncbi:MAG: glycosyltransferase family 4 protein [Alphaproteobacteria bacterium]|nr:glycosyltransferase family 4 protein [Alphaproteobacteria bacterium]
MSKEHPVILQVLPALDIGGVEEVVLETARAVKAAGYESIVASSGGRMIKHLDRAGITHITLPLDTNRNPWKIFKKNVDSIEKIIRDKGVDIVHAHSRAPAWSAYYACKRAGIPMVTTFHGFYGVKGWLGLKKKYNESMVKGKLIIAVSQFIKEHIVSVYGRPRDKIRLVYNGIDISKYSLKSVLQEQKEALLESWRVPENARIVLLPGRGTEWKGQKYMIEALKLIDRPDVYVVLFGALQGPQSYAQSLTQLAEKLGVDSRVRLTGIADIISAYALAEVVVNTSIKPETFGLTMIEAQAMQRIPISFDHGGPTETIKNGVTGFLVPLNNTQALADAVVKVLDMPEDQYEAVADAARQSVVENFSLEECAKKTIDIYKSLL